MRARRKKDVFWQGYRCVPFKPNAASLYPLLHCAVTTPLKMFNDLHGIREVELSTGIVVNDEVAILIFVVFTGSPS